MSTTPQPLTLLDSPLVKDLNAPFNFFLSRQVHAQTDPQRALQLAMMRRNDLYYHGKQYLTLTNSGGQLDYRPIGADGSRQSTQQGQVYDYVLNIFKGDIWKFIAVLGSRAPNIKALARDTKDEAHNNRRMTADRVAQYLRFHWKTDELQPLICMILAKYGTAFSYARYVSDERRFGKTSIPTLGMVDAGGPGTYECFSCGTVSPENEVNALEGLCPRCGTPLGPESLVPAEPNPTLQATGSLDYPNGSVDLDICTAATVNAPFWERDIEHCPWLLYQLREDRGRLALALPEYADKLRQEISSAYGTSQNSALEAYTQEQLKSPTGFPLYGSASNISQALYGRLFLQPWAYEYFPMDQSGNRRQQLHDQFPDGVMATLIDNQLIRLEPRRLTAHWASCKASASEGLYSPAYFEEYISGQDVINDLWNALVEAAERSIPIPFIHPSMIDPDRINSGAFNPGDIMFTKPSAGGDLSKMVYQLQAAKVDPQMVNFISVYIDRLRENHGIQPAIWGAADDATARQTDVNRNQALQILSVPWNALRAFNSRTMENGIMELANNVIGDELFLSNGTSGVPEKIQIPNLADLVNGGWFLDTDPNIPMSPGQRRDFVMNLLDQVGQNPDLANFLGLQLPENRRRFQEALGEDWEMPGIAERIKVLDTIQKLLQGEPIQPPPPLDPFSGMPIGPPPPPEPSIPYDPTFMDAALDLDVLKEWILSDDGGKAEMENPGGYANVLAYAQQVVAANKPAPAPIPTRLSLSGKLSEMVPPQEAAVLEQAGVAAAGGSAGPGGPPPVPGSQPAGPPGMPPGPEGMGGAPPPAEPPPPANV